MHIHPSVYTKVVLISPLTKPGFMFILLRASIDSRVQNYLQTERYYRNTIHIYNYNTTIYKTNQAPTLVCLHNKTKISLITPKQCSKHKEISR